MKKTAIAFSLLGLVLGPAAWAGGLITFTDGGAEPWCLDAYANTIASYELRLIAPVNPSFDGGGERAVTNIGGFECKLVPLEGVTILSVGFPVPAIDLGRDGEIIVGYGEPLPIGPHGYPTLATVDVLFDGNTSFPLPESSNWPCHMEDNTGIQITEIYFAGIDGVPAFVDADDPVDPLVPADVNPGLDLPIRLFKAIPVATDVDSWSGIKAMYR